MIRRFDAPRSGNQRGLSLFIVMVMLLLTTLLVLWAARSSLLNEKITRNDSDYLRAVEAAQAMVQDAVLDINGEAFPGVPCPTAATGNGCRAVGIVDFSTNVAYYPASKGEFDDLRVQLAGGTPPSCAGGICVPTAVDPEFWSDETKLAAMKPRGAAYGSRTGAVPATMGNPLLAGRGAQQAAWYWVELLPFTTVSMFGSGPAYVYAPDDGMPMYRITGIAEGRRGTRAVVQQIYVRKRLAS